MKMAKLFFFCSLPFFLLAGENHWAVGSRPISEEAQIQMEAQKNEGSSGFVFDHYPPIYFSNSHHWLISITVLDLQQYSLELEDGSGWQVNSYDGAKALNWRTNDPLTITQNNRWFSRYNYRIINKANGTSVEANLFKGPLIEGIYTRYIIGIDLHRSELILSDNTRWEISYLDNSIFFDWALSDAIIIGMNSSWDSKSEALLINVNMNNAARAKQF